MRTVTMHHENPFDTLTFLGVLAEPATWESLGSSANVHRIDTDTEVTVRTRIDPVDLPAALSGRLPSGAELIEVYRLPGDIAAGPAEIRMTAHAPGVPVEIDALVQVDDTETGGSHVDVRAEISSSIPMFGAMIEAALVPIFTGQLATRLERFARV